jgi:hypothetical protein
VNTRNYFHLGDRFGFFVDTVSGHIELQKGKKETNFTLLKKRIGSNNCFIHWNQQEP